MSSLENNKKVIRESIQTVWVRGELTALPDFWTDACVNHAMPGADNTGLTALRQYHETFFEAFASFSGLHIEIAQQVAEGDRVVTHLVSQGEHTGPFFGVPATGRSVSLATIRIDRLQDGKIAEHWSVADMAGLMQQIQG